MPLIKSSTKAGMRKNYKELMTTKPSKTRMKAIDTIAERRGVSRSEAKRIQAGAIARKVQERAAGKKGDRKLKDGVGGGYGMKDGRGGDASHSSGVRRLKMANKAKKK